MSGFGMESVSGRNRTPNPAPRTNALLIIGRIAMPRILTSYAKTVRHVFSVGEPGKGSLCLNRLSGAVHPRSGKISAHTPGGRWRLFSSLGFQCAFHKPPLFT